jgi:hypothetical protein
MTFKGHHMNFKECLSNLGSLSSGLSHPFRACNVPVVVDNSFSIHYIQLEDTKKIDLKTQVTFKGCHMTFKECLSNLGLLPSCLSHTFRVCGVPVVVDNLFSIHYIQLADSKDFKSRHMIFQQYRCKTDIKKNGKNMEKKIEKR